MSELDLLIDLHRDGPRQGPGGEAETRLAVALSGLAGSTGLRIADIGCGTGAATLTLAAALDAHFTGVARARPFLDRLAAGLSDRVTPLNAAMEALPFAPASLDAIWSEGAIYGMGSAAGVAAWRRFLKPGGVLAVTALTWLTDAPSRRDRGPLAP